MENSKSIVKVGGGIPKPDKMKTKSEIKALVRDVITEIMTENHNFKVGDKVKFNGNYDGVVVKVHTDGKLKGHIDVQKKGRSSTVTLHGGNKREVRLAESINESPTPTINPNVLSPTEQQLAVGLINALGHGSHPMADVKGLKYFKVDYLADIISKNKSRLRGDVKKHVTKILKKLSGAMQEAEIDESSKYLKYSDLLLAKLQARDKYGADSKEVKKINIALRKEMKKLGIDDWEIVGENSILENRDMVFVLDQLANAVDLYPKDEFAQHMAKNTKYDEKSFEKLYDAYFKMKAMDRFHMSIDINKSKKFLKKFGIKEEVESINENMSDLEFVVDQLANSMEHYDEKEFVEHMSKETKYNANSLKKVFNAYWDLDARKRDDMFTRVNTAKPWLKKFGIK